MSLNKEETEKLFEKLNKEAEERGYHLNPDEEHTKELINGILANQKRYGYWACPCRLASGIKDKDLDIICPCDYRDSDLNDYGSCYCSLYVSSEIKQGKKPAKPIPERRKQPKGGNMETNKEKLPVWRCRVCGYLCARENPPETCPICQAAKERFEIFM
ncbi:ferredoxin:glutaredoxin reductase [Candidatus Pacearchaeota archaeon]|nr:ferredoxin:glutaredoxin reductase [Candidatus Pacearchaeota archaeon]